MASKYKLGLINFSMGDIAGDGGMGNSLTPVGDTVADTAVLTTEEPATTDFNIEESDSPVMTIKNEPDKMSVAWSTYNASADSLVRLFGGTKVAAVAGKIATLGTVTPGTTYTNGTYNDVPLTGGTGSGAKADIVVAGAVVSTVTITDPGSGYGQADVLSADQANVGGTGTGFAVSVATITSTPERWEAPDVIPEIEQSLKGEWKQGGFLEIPRAKIIARLNMSFKRGALSQIDITATVLQPTKVNVSRLSITNA